MNGKSFSSSWCLRPPLFLQYASPMNTIFSRQQEETPDQRG